MRLLYCNLRKCGRPSVLQVRLRSVTQFTTCKCKFERQNQIQHPANFGCPKSGGESKGGAISSRGHHSATEEGSRLLTTLQTPSHCSYRQGSKRQVDLVSSCTLQKILKHSLTVAKNQAMVRTARKFVTIRLNMYGSVSAKSGHNNYTQPRQQQGNHHRAWACLPAEALPKPRAV